MPGLAGDSLARAGLRQRPGFPIILCTGFSETMDEEKARSLGIRAFLMKPFTMAKLADTVRAALAGD